MSSSSTLLQQAAAILAEVRKKKPLIHQLTNFVTVNDCANMTLAVGASPVMAIDPAEVEEMVSYASALVINIGALHSQFVDGMIAAGKRAAARGIPIIFDPVGVGATRLRTAAAEKIIREVHPSVIRGNMSEMKALGGLHYGSKKGVDSTADEADGEKIAAELSQKLDCVIAITGRIDIIAGNQDICHIQNGHPLLTGVTGTGCMATALAGSCCGAVDDFFAAAVAGIAIMGIAGEMAQQSLQPGEGLGTFRARLFDAVSRMDPDTILHYGRVR